MNLILRRILDIAGKIALAIAKKKLEERGECGKK